MNQRVAGQTPEQLSAFLAQGNIAGGMPSFADLSAADRVALAKYLRHLNLGIIVRPPVPTQPTRKITWGPPKPGDWLTYNGNVSANRYSPLKEINTTNVSSLKLKWIFPIQYFGLETTPLEADGVLYVTGRTRYSPLTRSPAIRFGSILALAAQGWLVMQNLALTAESPFFAIRSSL